LIKVETSTLAET